LLRMVYVAFLFLSLGVYAVLALSIATKVYMLSMHVVEYLNGIHLATLYLAIVLYIASYVKRLRLLTFSSMALLLVSSYSGVIVEAWRFECVNVSMIPPFVLVVSCSNQCRVLCNHFASYEISVPLITAVIVALWSIIGIVRLEKRSSSS